MRTQLRNILGALALGVAVSARMHAQVSHTNARTNLRDEPVGTSNVVAVLKLGARVTIVPDSSRRGTCECAPPAT